MRRRRSCRAPRPQYGYVIVDEAQDLTPMQLRMVARRSRNGDLTLVGDIAQATGPDAIQDWDEIARISRPIAASGRTSSLSATACRGASWTLANLVLPDDRAGPAARPSRSARLGSIPVRCASRSGDSPMPSPRRRGSADDERSVGVIVPRRHLVEIRGGARSARASPRAISRRTSSRSA